ncbi:unnamed protein product [Moneuplotes crassus]|uniref:BZIP domain-containing protein n=1 Tax=Euplotes crassus TaxID=5936 RepID=A0AAD1X5L5_EUPCR|nr:unnamed protein product [Moneuplotes crassus]
MITPKTEVSKENEEIKYPAIVFPRPSYSCFQPYILNKSEKNESSSSVLVSSDLSLASIPQKPKRTRRRRRLSCERDLSPETFRKTRNKRLAKESRARKGNYVKTLENKVQELEQRVVMLNEKLENFKKKISYLEIGDKRGYHNITEAQDYWHNQLSDALTNPQTSPDHLKDIVEYFLNTLGVAGSDRKKVIKNAIRVIIDNLLPETVKTLIYCNKKDPIANDKQLDSLRVASKYKYEEMMADNGFGIVEECLTKANINKEQRPIIKNYCRHLTEVRHYYQDIVNSTLALRKKIFVGMKKFEKITAELYKRLDIKQLGQFIITSRNIRTSHQIDIFSCWDIKKMKRGGNSEEISEYGLTDYDSDGVKS